MNDNFFMQAALKEARRAYDEGEVPVGAVIVLEGRIIARGRNQVELLQDATAHAEMLCIGAAASVLENWRLLNATLYCTMEPCCMCAGACFLSRIKKLVFGAPDLRHGANGSFVDLFALKHPTHQIEVVPHVMKEESAQLMQEFFRARRNKDKEACG